MFLAPGASRDVCVRDHRAPTTQLCGASRRRGTTWYESPSTRPLCSYKAVAARARVNNFGLNRRRALMGDAMRLRQRAHHRSMHQHDCGIALQHGVIPFPEPAWGVTGGEELARLDEQNLRLGADLVGRHHRTRRSWTTTVAGVADQLVDTHNQLRNGMQP